MSLLQYFHKEPRKGKYLMGINRRDISLHSITSISASVSSTSTFVVKLPERDFHFKALNASEANQWISSISAAKDSLNVTAKSELEEKTVINPSIGFVLKSRISSSGEKVFINVFSSDQVSTFMSFPTVSSSPSVEDSKEPIQAKVFSVVLPTAVVDNCKDNTEVTDLVRSLPS